MVDTTMTSKQSEELVVERQLGILVLCCLRPNWPESILSDAFVQVASFEQSRLVFHRQM